MASFWSFCSAGILPAFFTPDIRFHLSHRLHHSPLIAEKDRNDLSITGQAGDPFRRSHAVSAGLFLEHFSCDCSNKYTRTALRVAVERLHGVEPRLASQAL